MKEQSLLTESQPRDSRGRFATRDRAYADKMQSENKWLRLQVEKWQRLAELAERKTKRLEGQLTKIKALL